MARKIAAYVQTSDGRPLMPVHSYGRVKRMLRSGKARIVRTLPFTIRLLYDLKEEHTDTIILGMDPGRTNIGLCAVDARGHVLYASDIETRNKTVAALMLERKQHRQASRRGERLRRKRRAKKRGAGFAMEFYKSGMGLRPMMDFIWERYLPQCKEPISVKNIRNSEARFCNRKRKRGWLTPTANQLLQTHQGAVNLVLKLLPVTDIVVELNRFSFARMETPDISGKEFQNGPLKGFPSVKAAVSEQQGGKCLFCKNKIEHCHHIVPRSRGGSDTLQNRAGLCAYHHSLVHKDQEWHDKMVKKKAGLEKKYHALSTLNQIIPYLWRWLWDNFRPFIGIHASGGKRTHDIREEFALSKEHYADAWCVAVSVLDRDGMDAPDFEDVFHVMQFRRHNRAVVQRMESRKYLLDGKVVAVNRHKAVMAVPKNHTEDPAAADWKAQTEDSLAEFREKMALQYGELEAERIISRLKAVKGRYYYNKMDRILPGAVFEAKDGTRFVLQGSHSNCTRYPDGMNPVRPSAEVRMFWICQ